MIRLNGTDVSLTVKAGTSGQGARTACHATENLSDSPGGGPCQRDIYAAMRSDVDYVSLYFNPQGEPR